MAFTFAGHYGPQAVIDDDGNARLNATLRVRNPNGSVATIYDDRTKNSESGNPFAVDELANFEFWADPGDYTIEVNHLGTTVWADVVTVPLDPQELTDHIEDPSAAHAATAVSFEPAEGVVSSNVQAAIEEIASEAAADSDLQAHLSDSSAAHVASAIGVTPTPGVASTDAQGAFVELGAHLVDTSGAHAATAVSVSPTGNIISTDVQGALAELDSEKAIATDLTAHLSDTSDAHDATAISVAPAGSISSTTVQGALEELDADVQAGSGLAAHLADTSDAHDASAISFSATGGLSATDVQAALAELDSEKETPAGAQTKATTAETNAATYTDTQVATRILLTEKAAADGVATLGPDGKVPSSQIPPLSTGQVWPVNSQAEMLALSAVEGDIAIRQEFTPDKFFILTTNSPSTLADWFEFTFAGGVSSVNGDTGPSVVLTAANIGSTATGSISSTNVQAAIAELESEKAPAADLTAHISDATDAHDASAISVSATGGISSTDVQSALAELDSEKATSASLTAHLNDTTDAHAGSAITNTPAGNIAGTTVQAAINELDSEKALASDLTAHISDAVAAHAATAISYAGGTGISATTVEGAIDELATEKANASDLTAHVDDTAGAHAASAISVTPFGSIAATTVQAALQEIFNEAGGGSGSGHIILESGTAIDAQPNLNFNLGLIATEDESNSRIDVDLEYGTVVDVQDVGATEASGTSTKVARADHVHAHPIGILPDAHHNQSHGQEDHTFVTNERVLGPFTSSSSVALTNSDQALKQFTLDSDVLEVGSTYDIYLAGFHGAQASSGTLTLKLKLGGVTVCSDNIGSPTSKTGAAFIFAGRVTIRSVGTSGKATGHFAADHWWATTPAHARAASSGGSGPTAGEVTVNTGADPVLEVTAVISATAHADSAITIHTGFVDKVK